MSLKTIEFFFLNTWLWSMTWGLFHVPLNMLIVIVLLKFVGRFKLISSILLAVFAKVFSVALYAVIIGFFLVVLDLQFVPPGEFGNSQGIDVLFASICLGLVYTAFEVIFFFMVNKFYALNVRVTILIAFVGNIISALLMYWFLEVN